MRENDLSLDRTIRVFETAMQAGQLVACVGMADIIISMWPSRQDFGVKAWGWRDKC
ncbi:hypothetical protein [Erwinia tasmaniensis]|uniref:hypothetical protein n=1 Tax=Erwinia tasmaniensis TaxID=338565 RepID=UPI003A4DF502